MIRPMDRFYNEIYSYYYNTVARLIALAVRYELDEDSEYEVLHENAFFSEDLIIRSLHDGLREWRLLGGFDPELDVDDDYHPNIEYALDMPVTTLEKRWLKSILTDPRIRLFGADISSHLEDVEPLFDPGDIVTIGRYHDGDPYTDAGYIRRFRTILDALHSESWALRIVSENARGETKPEPIVLVPDHLEYSELEDKFRLYGYVPGTHYTRTVVNLGRITECIKVPHRRDRKMIEPRQGRIELLLDGRTVRSHNSLERMMIAFSHYNRKVYMQDDGDYRIEISYRANEEFEVTILSLMPIAQYIKVIAPESIRKELAKRIHRQGELFRGIGVIESERDQ